VKRGVGVSFEGEGAEVDDETWLAELRVIIEAVVVLQSTPGQPGVVVA